MYKNAKKALVTQFLFGAISIYLLYLPITVFCAPSKFMKLSIPASFVKEFTRLQIELEIDILFFGLPSTSAQTIFSDIERVVKSQEKRDRTLLFVYTQSLNSIFVRATPDIQINSEFMHSINDIVLSRVKKGLVVGNAGNEHFIKVCLDAIRKSKELYHVTRNRYQAFDVAVGRVLDKLNNISLNQSEYYQHYILAPVVLFASLLLMEIGATPYLLVIFAIAAFALRWVVLYPVAALSGFLRSRIIRYGKAKTQFIYQMGGFLISIILDKSSKYLFTEVSHFF